MKVIPYASDIGSIKYAMVCARPIVCPSLSLAREYNNDLGVDHQTLVKIILRGLRIYFSVMEVIKEFVVKSYVDASFYTDPDDSKSQSGYVLNMRAISQSGSMQSIVDIDICKVHTNLNVADPLTKNLSHKQNMITHQNYLSLITWRRELDY